MQRNSCEALQLLVSKYADGEVSAGERAIVDQHVAGCTACACKLTEYMEVAAIFSEAPIRPAEPQVRAGLYRAIARQKEEEHRAAHRQPAESSWRLPDPLSGRATAGKKFSLPGTLVKTATPFAAATVALFSFLWLVTIGVKPPSDTQNKQPADVQALPIFVPTLPPQVVSNSSTGSNIPAVETSVSRIAGLASPAVEASASAVVRSGPDRGVDLSQPTPVMENNGAVKFSDWHLLRDATYGYSASYPPNWWSYAQGQTRYFYPWTPGGSQNAPYWIELSVAPNSQRLTVMSAKSIAFKSASDIEPGFQGEATWLRRSSADVRYVYDELYGFDPDYVYTLRLAVSAETRSGNFKSRWESAEGIFSRMSGKMLFGPATLNNSSAYGRFLFLNGANLASVNISGASPQPELITRGYGVRSFALSPDLGTVAFASTATPTGGANDSALWASDIYLARISDQPSGARLLWSADEVQEVAWYSDRTLLAIAKGESGFGIYRLDTGSMTSDNPIPASAQSIVSLAGMSGVKSLAVSPDRQFITFIASAGKDSTSVGGSNNTDIYAVRPDGSDLHVMVSHASAVQPPADAQGAFSVNNQAIKSYTWAGSLSTTGGYTNNLLFTCGNAFSASFYPGGALYSALTLLNGPAVGFDALRMKDPAKSEIVHLAYSNSGKLAITGYYIDYNQRADQLAGLWVADVVGGVLSNIQTMPMPEGLHGIADLQWSPDGKSLIYRETIPASAVSITSRYDGQSAFLIQELNVATRQSTLLYSSDNR